MADNTTLNAGSGGDVIATDDIGGVKHQLVKVEFGAADSATQVSAAAPLPVVQTGAHAVNATLAAETTKVIGTVNVAAAQTLATVTTVAAVTAITNALPAGANAIGKLAANSGVDIGDVDVTTVGTVTPGVAATSLGKAEDAVAADGDVGVAVLAVRRDAAASGVSADGDYANLSVDSTGALRVTGGGGGTQFAEDSAHVSGDTGTLGLAVRRDANTTLVNADGDYAPLQVNTAGSLKVEVTSGGTAGTQFAEDAAHTSGDVGTLSLAVRRDANSTFVSADGDYSPLAIDATGNLKVNVVTGGTAGTQFAEDAAAVSGDVGTMALAVRRDTAASSSGTDGDYSTLNTDANGRLHVIAALAAAQTLATVTAVTAITNALPAGTNAIGKLSANSGVDIGDVDVTTVGTITPGTAATSLGKAEDAAAASGDTGVSVLSVRQDTLASSTSADGDYAAVKSSSTGAVYVNVAEGGIAGRAEDAAAAGGEDGIPILAVRRDSASSGVSADGDWANLSVTSDGSLRVSGSSGTTQYAEDVASAGAESLCLAGSVRRDTAAASAGTDGDYATINTDANGRLHVITGPSTGTIETVGDVAHDAVSAGNPVLVGAYASAAAPANVSADADTTHLWALQNGALAVQPTMAGVLAVAGNGASGTGVQRVTIANDSTGVLATVTNVATIGTSVTPGTAAANLGKAEDAAHASGDTGVMLLSVRSNTAAATSGSDGDYQPLITDTNGRLHVISPSGAIDDAAFTPATGGITVAGFTADETATDSVDEGDAGAARMTLDRKQIVAEYVHAAAGGSSNYSALSAAAVLTAQIKGSAGRVYGIQVFNTNAAARFVRLYDQTGAPASTDGANVVWRGIIPGAATGAGFTIVFPKGKQFATGIGIRASAAVADNDTTVLAANEQAFNVDYA